MLECLGGLGKVFQAEIPRGVQVFKTQIPQGFRFLMLEFIGVHVFQAGISQSGFQVFEAEIPHGVLQQHVPSTWGVRILNGIAHSCGYMYANIFYQGDHKITKAYQFKLPSQTDVLSSTAC